MGTCVKGETRQKEKGRGDAQYAGLSGTQVPIYGTPPEPEDNKNGEIQAGSGHVHITACGVASTPHSVYSPVSPRARAAPTRTPMLRETDSRHRSTRRGQCYGTALHVFSLRPAGASYSYNCIICPGLDDMALLLSDEQTTTDSICVGACFKGTAGCVCCAPPGAGRVPTLSGCLVFSLLSFSLFPRPVSPCSFCLDIRTPQ